MIEQLKSLKILLFLLLAVNASGQPVQRTNYSYGLFRTNWYSGWYSITNRMASLYNSDGNYEDGSKLMLVPNITSECVTNWVTTSIEYSVRPETKPGLNIITLEYRATGYHETGIVLSNTIATVKWHGKPVSFTLESVVVTQLKRVEWR